MEKRRTSLIDKEIGALVRARRVELGISQGALGELLGLTFQQVQKYEKGSNRISAGRLREVADALNVPISFFYSTMPTTADPSPEEFLATTFLQSVLGLRLLKAFDQIKDRKLQERIVKFVESVNDNPDPSK